MVSPGEAAFFGRRFGGAAGGASSSKKRSIGQAPIERPVRVSFSVLQGMIVPLKTGLRAGEAAILHNGVIAPGACAGGAITDRYVT